MVKENQLLEQKELREKVMENIGVLDKVKELILLGKTNYSTMQQIANYYEVDVEVIKKQFSLNRNEILNDGVKEFGSKDLKDFLVSESISPTNHKGYFMAEGQKFSNGKTFLFPKRAMFRFGLLLRDSKVAKEIRTMLLNVYHDAESKKENIIENIVNEISEEKQLMFDRVEAEMNGDYSKVCEINSKLFALKNKRIKELETENENITTHALTISESRDVINRLTRNIAVQHYKGQFGKAYGDLYSKVNYKLGINIKSRTKKAKESYLHTLTEEETYQVELITRSWATKLGLEVESLLKLA